MAFVSNLFEYQIRFLDEDGCPLADVAVVAPSLPFAMDRAKEIATEIAAADFSIMLLPPKTGR
jgi:hypothetical protein